MINDSLPKSKDVFERGKGQAMENRRMMTIRTWIGSPVRVYAQSTCQPVDQHMDPQRSIQSAGHQGSGVPQPDTQFPQSIYPPLLSTMSIWGIHSPLSDLCLRNYTALASEGLGDGHRGALSCLLARQPGDIDSDGGGSGGPSRCSRPLDWCGLPRTLSETPMVPVSRSPFSFYRGSERLLVSLSPEPLSCLCL